MTDQAPSPDEKLAEIRRELRMRERVYPRMVTQGSMSAEEAERRIRVMRSIAADYDQPDLFAQGERRDWTVEIPHRGEIS